MHIILLVMKPSIKDTLKEDKPCTLKEDNLSGSQGPLSEVPLLVTTSSYMLLIEFHARQI